MSAKDHWNNVYANKDFDAVSWYAPRLDRSSQLIEALCRDKAAAIIDIGAGQSTLVDDLLRARYRDVSVLDVSDTAIEFTKGRLGDRSKRVTWHVGDVTRYSFGAKQFDLWHDRAVFHFLTEPNARALYIDKVRHSVKVGGYIVMATFGPDGPLQCSGLDVVRYDAERLQHEFGDSFNLLGSELTNHLTPMGTNQQFLYCWLQASAHRHG